MFLVRKARFEGVKLTDKNVCPQRFFTQALKKRIIKIFTTKPRFKRLKFEIFQA